MPGATLPNISIVLPTLGGDTGVWDESANVGRSAQMTLLERMLKFVAYDHGCWLWRGALNPAGYGVVHVTGESNQLVHRAMYAQTTGPLGDYHVDHLCRNKACCNPLHLELVTHAENVRRSSAGQYLKDRTHCPSGHEYTPANTRLKQPGNRRECRECGRIYSRRKKAERGV